MGLRLPSGTTIQNGNPLARLVESSSSKPGAQRHSRQAPSERAHERPAGALVPQLPLADALDDAAEQATCRAHDRHQAKDGHTPIGRAHQRWCRRHHNHQEERPGERPAKRAAQQPYSRVAGVRQHSELRPTGEQAAKHCYRAPDTCGAQIAGREPHPSIGPADTRQLPRQRRRRGGHDQHHRQPDERANKRGKQQLYPGAAGPTITRLILSRQDVAPVRITSVSERAIRIVGTSELLGGLCRD